MQNKSKKHPQVGLFDHRRIFVWVQSWPSGADLVTRIL